MKTLISILLIGILPLHKIIAQSIISGKITDNQTKEIIYGVLVSVKGTSHGDVSSSDGTFAIQYPGAFPLVLKFSMVGYEPKELILRDASFQQIMLNPDYESLQELIVTARRRNEEIQDIPLPVSVIGGRELDNAMAFNVNRVKELVPSVQLYSSNPRNTTLNIRGIGSTFGLTNDGIDPGVGFYVDGVYFARPAATTLDFIDVQQVEVLRGPQGTLFGKNTTAGTFNITSRKPSFITSGTMEQSFGNFGFIQTKGTLSGPIIKDKLAGRISFTGTQREGTIYNLTNDIYTNTLNNQGVRTQLLFLPNDKLDITLSADYTRQRPDGYAVVFAGVAPTQRPDFRQFENIIADLNYDLPSRNPFDRIIDHDTPWRSNQDMGGVSLNADYRLSKGTLTSTSAWRYWLWGPSNDRDFTGLQALALSQAPSVHNQWSQEIRYSGDINSSLSGVIGVFAFYQNLEADGAHREESGIHQWRFVQNNQNPLWQTPGLLEGYGINTYPSFNNFSGALFAQIDWLVNEKITLIPGIRLNYDQKSVDFRRETYGGLQTTDPELLALKRSVYSNQAFTANVEDWNLSGKLTGIYKFNDQIRAFTSYSLGFKPVGLNLGGLPTENGEPILDLAVIRPERVSHLETMIKSEPFKNATLNLTGFYTDIFDYQTLVQSPQLGVNRGYLANAPHVRTMGLELESSYQIPKLLRLNAAVSLTDGRYVSFENAPLPLEETGLVIEGQQITFKDISGTRLPGISRWAITAGAEVFKSVVFLQTKGELFFGTDLFYRSEFSSSPTPSAYLNIDGYSLINARFGFRTRDSYTIFIWSRNLTNVDYFEQLLPAAGNAGHFGAVLGDPRTYGITIRYAL
jgi:iron complex outermembrane recepter protein